MIRRVIFLVLLASVLADDCLPLYWEVNPNYKVVTNEVEIYAKNPLQVGSVNTSVTENLTKITYSLNDIKVKQTYDGSRVIVKYVWMTCSGNGTGLISISNNIINLAFAYDANSKRRLT